MAQVESILHIVALKSVTLIVSFNVRCYSFMTPTNKGGGAITKFWEILRMLVDGVLGGGIFLLQ